VGTFHGFNGVPGQARIDWILATSHFKPVVAETVSAKFDDHWPSDHFPVFAEFLWDAKDAE
jgi:endonuclease/exonuclease/phosphatase family metal-dependent hydrolase